jgi:hypothetical protein
VGLLLRSIAACGLLACVVAGRDVRIPAAFIFTDAPRYEVSAAERFPAGAALQFVTGGQKKTLVPGFASSADANVSFDGQRVLFSGKLRAGSPWQIWEVPVGGGAARQVAATKEDAVTPFYLPGDRIVYAKRTPSGFQIVRASLDGGEPLQLTYAPGNHLVCDVLRDGRILFEAGGDLYTVYSDGSGVESYRCDHKPGRHGGRELSSGDILFASGGRLARFTSSRAVQVDVPMPEGEFAGGVSEAAPGEWLLSYRPNAAAAFGLYLWKTLLHKVMPAGVQPVVVTPRPVPKAHPSSLGDRDGANLLCLNVYTSKLKIAPGSVASVRVRALDDRGTPVVMGVAPVERDGSFYVNLPGERPVQFELLDRAGKTAAAEKGWFWARRGEQRVCVGCHAGPERAPENAVPEVLLRTTDPAKLRIQ